MEPIKSKGDSTSPKYLEEFIPKTLKEAMVFVGSLSNTSKMPGLSWGIPTSHCKTGMMLAKKKGSVCSLCYADKRGMYRFSNVQNAQQKRLDLFNENDLRWLASMWYILKKKKSTYFRFFDSGDIQSEHMLLLICQLAQDLPEIKFWVPTKENAIVRKFITKYKGLPSNLNIMVSGHFIGNKGVEIKSPLGVVLGNSSVHKEAGKPPEGYSECPAYTQDNECKDCRACWDFGNKVSYLLH